MSIGIGIDTGGTFTDIVIYDFSKDRVISKGKTPTTKEDLRICINNALDMADEKYLKEAVQISLSTTLATNA
ncbi:MAG: hydantoinase/oxoprolinase family protein, partial [Eubacteriaceae bacterium]|nr:hydantoinase/oxoprolinase family protein [Eubacteriaceae bacterium]